MSDRRAIAVGETIINFDVVKRADGSPVTTGTVNYYLLCQSGTNAGKWWKDSTETWEATAQANEMTHVDDGHWTIELTSSPFAAGMKCLEYVKESGDLHVALSRSLVGSNQPVVNAAGEVLATVASFGAAVWRALCRLVHLRDGHFVFKDGDDDTGDGTAAAPFETVPKGVSESSHGGLVGVGPGEFAGAVDASALDGLLFRGAGRATIITQGSEDYTLSLGDAPAVADMTVIQTKAAAPGLAAIECEDCAGVLLSDVRIESTATGVWGYGATGRADRLTITAAESGIAGGSWLISDPDFSLSGWTECACYAFQPTGASSVYRGRLRAVASTLSDFVAVLDDQSSGLTRLYDVDCYAQNTTGFTAYGFFGNGSQAYNCTVRAVSAGEGNAVGAQNMRLFGGSASASSNGDPEWTEVYDIADCTVAGVAYDTAKTSGTITHVEPGTSLLARLGIEGGLAKEETLDAVAALIAAIKARTDTLGAGVVSYVGSVASGGTANLYQDNDYTEVLGNRPYWDITGYSGPDIDGEEGEFRMARARRIADSSGAPFAAEFECACTFAQTGSTVRATLDDVEADDLAGLIVEGARTNYTWQIWHGSRALATGTLVLHRGVAAAS